MASSSLCAGLGADRCAGGLQTGSRANGSRKCAQSSVPNVHIWCQRIYIYMLILRRDRPASRCRSAASTSTNTHTSTACTCAPASVPTALQLFEAEADLLHQPLRCAVGREAAAAAHVQHQQVRLIGVGRGARQAPAGGPRETGMSMNSSAQHPTRRSHVAKLGRAAGKRDRTHCRYIVGA